MRKNFKFGEISQLMGVSPTENRREYMKRYYRLRCKQDPNYSKDRKRVPSKYNPIKEKERRKRLRLEALTVYGGKCENCNIDDIYVLQFHHKNGNSPHDGKREKTRELYARIIRDGRLKDIQLLCANHHILANIRDGTK